MSTRAAWALVAALCLLALAIGYHACIARKAVRTAEQLHKVLREIQQAGFGEETP